MSESSTSVKRIEEAEKQRQALELRKAGAGFEEIARALGFRHASGAHYAVKTALRKTIQQPADELRELETARLDDLLRGIWVEARKGNVAKIDRALKIMARRANLLGLDAPKAYKDVTDARKDAEAIAAEIGRADDPAVVERIHRDLLISQEAR